MYNVMTVYKIKCALLRSKKEFSFYLMFPSVLTIENSFTVQNKK